MRRVLNGETARPLAANRHWQRERFDRFRDDYSQVRPHEALARPMPASAHARSAREYPEREPDLEYPPHWKQRRMHPDGSLKFRGRQPHLSEDLAGEAVGMVEVKKELWQIWFCDYKVAVLDSAQGEFWGVGSAGRRPEAIQAAMEAAKASTITLDGSVNNQVG